MVKFGQLLTVCLLGLLTGCASTQQPVTADSKSFSELLYLRGSFTWFDAEDEFKVKEHADSVYRAKVDLVADGQAYEFKFADESWSSGFNCGYLSKSTDEVVTLGTKVTANCLAKYEFFRFTPTESGKYVFYIDFSSSKQQPSVWVEAYQSDLIDDIVEPIKNNLPDL